MKMIAAVSADWGIGRDNSLLFSLPTDMKFFRRMTLEKTVIVGRNTLLSFPGGKPLPKRRTILVSGTICPDGVEVCRTVEEAAKKAGDESFVIGGEQIYRAFLPLCDTAYVTYVKSAPPADAFFPNLDEDPEWELSEESEVFEENGLEFTFRTYRRIKA